MKETVLLQLTMWEVISARWVGSLVRHRSALRPLTIPQPLFVVLEIVVLENVLYLSSRRLRRMRKVMSQGIWCVPCDFWHFVFSMKLILHKVIPIASWSLSPLVRRPWTLVCRVSVSLKNFHCAISSIKKNLTDSEIDCNLHCLNSSSMIFTSVPKSCSLFLILLWYPRDKGEWRLRRVTMWLLWRRRWLTPPCITSDTKHLLSIKVQFGKSAHHQWSVIRLIGGITQQEVPFWNLFCMNGDMHIFVVFFVDAKEWTSDLNSKRFESFWGRTDITNPSGATTEDIEWKRHDKGDDCKKTSFKRE